MNIDEVLWASVLSVSLARSPTWIGCALTDECMLLVFLGTRYDGHQGAT